MSSFAYKARDNDGKLVQGVIDAQNETEAAGKIEKLELIPVSICASAAAAAAPSLNVATPRFGKISHQELLVFTRQLSTLIGTGAPLIQSLNNVAEQTDNPKFKQIILTIISSLEGGNSLSEALAQYPQIFPNLYISLVKVGEAAGLLDKVLNRLAELSTQEIDMRSRLQMALVYPIVLAVVAFLIVNFVLIGVLPKFVSIFEASSAKLPPPTVFLLFLSNLVRHYWWLFLIGMAVCLGWFRSFYKTAAGKNYIDATILKLPLFGPLILKIIVSRFARSIAALTQAGVPVLDALAVVESTVPNSALQNVISNTRTAISQGQPLTEPFRASGLFPPMVIQLISTGERTGKLDSMFDQIADFYEPEIEYTVRNLTSLLEPIMLLGMGMVVAFIALSVLMPIFNLISVIRR